MLFRSQNRAKIVNRKKQLSSYLDNFVLVFFNNMGAHQMNRLAYFLAEKSVKTYFTKTMKIRLNNFDAAIYKTLHVFVITRALN